MLVVVMFVSAILVLRHLDLTRGKLEAEEVSPISPVILVTEEEEEEDVLAGVQDPGKEDD
jgi:hypothetical protein